MFLPFKKVGCRFSHTLLNAVDDLETRRSKLLENNGRAPALSSSFKFGEKLLLLLSVFEGEE